MNKVEKFCYRGLHYILRHLASLDQVIEEKLIQEKKQIDKSGIIYSKFKEKDSFFNEIEIITHAGGGLQGMSYLNCCEAPNIYYEQGNRVFEFDIQRTIDHQYICAHDDLKLLKDEWLGHTIDARFHPMSMDKVFDYIKKHKDIKVIFDFKSEDIGGFAQFVYENLVDDEDLRRIVIQVFNEYDAVAVQAIYPFKMLYVLMMNTNYIEAINICLKYNIGAVSISMKAMDERDGWKIFDEYKICTFAYTVNNVGESIKCRDNNITGIFSDFLVNRDVKIIKQQER